MNNAKRVCSLLCRHQSVLALSHFGAWSGRPSICASTRGPPLRLSPLRLATCQYRSYSSDVNGGESSDSTSGGAPCGTGVDGGVDAGQPSTEHSEPLDSDTFVRLVSSINDRNSSFVVALQKFKDQLQADCSRAYPFRLRDLRTLLEFSSQLLGMQSDPNASEVISGAFELFKSDGSASAAFHLCRLFSSFNNCLGRTMTSTVFQRVVNNRVGMMGAKFLSPKKMDNLREKVGPGAEIAMKFLASAITDRDITGLEGCCEKSLFDFLNQGLGYLDRMGLKLNFEVSEVKDTKLDVFWLTIGGKRGSEISSPYLMKQALAHQILVELPKKSGLSSGSPDEDTPMNRQQNRELVMKTFEKGILARMEVLLTVRQSLSLLDSRGSTVWEDNKKIATHKLTFESEIAMRSRDDDDIETKDWTVVDINGVLNSNAPFAAR
ncbi:IS116 IS110 IS902 family protein, putative [Babesia ovata]|uniref:IS116 IS110 IS902 family protein, putative n=1 Tax=Babesia ovata TaxID=189622 RepID=A0A2H6K8N2_9APIC|nr:IS116 IS110 IS902 family protein, putative [Babesia ovata]GBE59340.1 IS116 IS110 IS902 family protein, putative [Babesia ovata]